MSKVRLDRARLDASRTVRFGAANIRRWQLAQGVQSCRQR